MVLVLVWLWGVLDDAVVVARERWWDGRERHDEGGRGGGREGEICTQVIPYQFHAHVGFLFFLNILVVFDIQGRGLGMM